MEEWLIPYLIVVGMMVVFGYSLFNHFTQLFESQMDVTDRILELFHSMQEPDEPTTDGEYVFSKDEGRTHILGGFVHGHAICSDDCWCKEEE
jgi:hypothetical protein|tara:strand:+ start:3487 stop:3762 length:276 start_codon:yes stop_codon:yes gene_type:complete